MHIQALKIAFSEAERKQILNSIDQILISGKLSQGRYVQELEERFASYIGVRHAIAVNSGSSAIEIPMRVLNVSDKQVIVPTNTFLATAAGVLLAGGKVRLADIDAGTLAPDLSELQKRANPETVGVILVHIGGIISSNIVAIRKWCDEQGYWLFEDAAHAHGSTFDGRFAGSFGKVGSYSFFATKVMTCGEGGMIVTDDDELAHYFTLYRNHGKPYPWESYHTHLGSNYRMSEVTAAIALAQLSRLDEMIAARTHLAEQYTSLLAEHIPALHPILPAGRSSWYKYIVILPEGYDRSLIKQRMKERGVDLPGGVYEIPLHRQPVLAHLANDGPFVQADEICQQHLCLPIYPSLTDEQAEYVILTLAAVMHAS